MRRDKKKPTRQLMYEMAARCAKQNGWHSYVVIGYEELDRSRTNGAIFQFRDHVTLKPSYELAVREFELIKRDLERRNRWRKENGYPTFYDYRNFEIIPVDEVMRNVR